MQKILSCELHLFQTILVISLSYLSCELFDSFLFCFFCAVCGPYRAVDVARFQSVRDVRGASYHQI